MERKKYLVMFIASFYGLQYGDKLIGKIADTISDEEANKYEKEISKILGILKSPVSTYLIKLYSLDGQKYDSEYCHQFFCQNREEITQAYDLFKYLRENDIFRFSILENPEFKVLFELNKEEELSNKKI